MALNVSKKFMLKIILDIISLLVIGLLLLALYLFIPPVQRGFFCDDLSIRYPYRESTIGSYSLAALVLVPIIIAMAGVETYRYKNKHYTTKIYKTISREIYDKFVPFLFGALTSLLCTLVAKSSTGRLRPYFHSVCKPNVMCDESNNAYQYIEHFDCPGFADSSSDAVNEIRLSFMSGHSSLMAYAMVYLAIYLQIRYPISETYGPLVRATIQGLALNLALYVGYTRISDYWHHWSDVLIGLIQGTIAAILTIRYLSDLCVKKSLSLNEFLVKNDNKFSDIENSDNKTIGDFQVRLLKATSI